MNWENEHAICCLEGLRNALAHLRGTQAATDGAVPGDPAYEWPAQRWALHLAAAAAERLEGLLVYESSKMLASLEPACAALGEELGLEEGRRGVVMEDTVRAQPGAAASQVLAVVLPALRLALHMDPWGIVAPMPTSGGSLVGRLRRVASLADVQSSMFEEATVLLVDQVQPSRIFRRTLLFILVH
jgi:hypothetical protein